MLRHRLLLTHFFGEHILCAPLGNDCGLLQVVLHHLRAHRTPVPTRVVLWPRNRPIPCRHHSSLASIEWVPATGRDWKSCSCSWMLEDRQACVGTGTPRTSDGLGTKKSAQIRAERWRRPWRVQKTSALAHRHGRRRGNHYTSNLCSLFYFFPASFCSPFPHVLFGSLTVRARFCFAGLAEVTV